MKKKKSKAKVKVKAKARKPAKAKKSARKAAPKKKAASKSKVKAKKRTGKSAMSVIPPPNSTLIGRVEDYYAHIGVIAFTLSKGLRVGDHIHVLGHTTNLEQTVGSMQINHQSVQNAGPKEGVGIKITSRARRGDYIFLING